MRAWPALASALVRRASSPSLTLRARQERDAGGRARLDFTDASATRALTAALLRDDFAVAWWLPDGHLCPTLTSRCNYIHWLEDLLALSPPPGCADGAGIRGVDVGTGASAIYALLGAAMNGWCAAAALLLACWVCARVLRPQLLMRARCCGVCVRALLRLSRAFVATDVAPVALRWAARNVAANPRLAHLIQARARAAALSAACVC